MSATYRAKPASPRVQWGHPLSRGVSCLLPFAGVFADPASPGNPGVPDGTKPPTWSAGAWGPASAFDGTGQFLTRANFALPTTCVVDLLVTAANSDGTIRCVCRSADSNFCVYNWAGTWTFYSGTTQIGMDAGSTLGQAAVAIGRPTHLTVRLTPATAYFYVNGALTRTFTFAFPGVAAGAIRVGADAFNQNFSGTVSLFRAAARASSDAEAVALAADPFAPVRPKTVSAAWLAGASAGADAGTGAATLGRVTSSGSGTVTNPGSGADTLGRVTASGSGTVTDTGSGSVTLAPVTAAGSGTVTVTTDAGSGADTLGRATASGSGSVTDAGAGASTLAPVTASGAGAVTGDQALGSFWECLFAWYARDAGARAACPGGLVNAEAAPDQATPYARVWELEDQEPESQDDREVDAAVSFYEADDNAGTSGDAGARAAGSAFSARLLDPLSRGEWRFFDGPDVWRESGVLWIPPGKLTVAGKAAGGRRVWRYDLWFKFLLTRPG